MRLRLEPLCGGLTISAQPSTVTPPALGLSLMRRSHDPQSKRLCEILARRLPSARSIVLPLDDVLLFGTSRTPACSPGRPHRSIGTHSIPPLCHSKHRLGTVGKRTSHPPSSLARTSTRSRNVLRAAAITIVTHVAEPFGCVARRSRCFRPIDHMPADPSLP